MRPSAAISLLAAAGISATAGSSEALGAIRVPMCAAVIREMHGEIHKHRLRKHGEDEIYETVPAICLAIVQNYTLSRTEGGWTLRQRDTRIDDEIDPDPATFEHLVRAARGLPPWPTACPRARESRPAARPAPNVSAGACERVVHVAQMTLKQSCEAFTDALQQELSELMYRETYRRQT